MAATDFPASPTNGQTYTANGVTWTYVTAKTRWIVTNYSANPIGYTGSQGTVGYTGSQGTVGYTGSQGAIGYTGSQGAIGYTGSVGNEANINATDDTTTTTLYPVMVGAAGSSQVAKVATTDIKFNAATGTLYTTAGSLGTTAGSQAQIQILSDFNGNNEYLEITSTRQIAGSVWNGAGIRLQEKIDATWMGYIQFNGGQTTANDGGISFGTGTTTTSAVSILERMRIDANGLITQLNATSGRGDIAGTPVFRLTADAAAAIGPTIADYYGATSAISLEATSMYEITFHTYFSKTTANTVTFTLTASSAPTSVVANYIGTPITGTGGTGVVGTITSLATAATAFAATGSLTTGVNHAYHITARVLTNLATSFKLQITSATGTVTPKAGSYYTVRKISATTGTFV